MFQVPELRVHDEATPSTASNDSLSIDSAKKYWPVDEKPATEQRF